MSTVDDLRSTLEDRARAVDDPGASPRVVAVHERVRGLRRRRRAAAGALAAVVVAAGVGLAALGPVGGGDGPAPAEGPRTLAGQEVPATVSLLGVRYDFETAVEVDVSEGTARVSFEPGEQPVAVSLVASGLDGGTATLVDSGDGVARSLGAGSVERPVPLPSSGTSLRVVLDDVGPDAQVALAVYQRGDEPPAGVVAPGGDAWFRAERAGEPLLGGGFTDPGGNELQVRFELDERQRVRFSSYCTADAPGAWVNIDIDDQPGFSRTSCDEDAPADASGSWGSPAGPLGAGTHTMRVYLTRGSEGPLLEDPDALLGVAAYAEPETVEVAEAEMDRVIEVDGRLWELDAALPATRDGEPVARRVESSPGPRVVGFAARGGIVGLRVEGGGAGSRGLGSSLIDARGGASTIVGTLLGGDDYELSLREDRGRPTQGTIVLYRPVFAAADGQR
ncbi:hypothetical protein QWJ41_00615 [Nocardioides sp. SOB44]|jgi:hypothetical protein|uniref:Uncharacterized protein n=1 Tax=Nocardioides cremeus TaxID=3058044 RepID=A0ABT8TLW6_9ACTN|nr:hypothetical protein [Nocardioides cremeus]MDO3394213.1 hypothetical protein [Nocardioides cremeus]